MYMKNITASFRIFIIGNLQLFYYAKNFYKRLLVSLSKHHLHACKYTCNDYKNSNDRQNGKHDFRQDFSPALTAHGTALEEFSLVKKFRLCVFRVMVCTLFSIFFIVAHTDIY